MEEVVVTSRDDGGEHNVRVWFVIAPPGVVYLFTWSFSMKARRWRVDPWVRVTIPASGKAVEGVLHFLGADEVDPAVADLVSERWGMWGATHLAGLRRMISGGTHVLVRVEAAAV